MPDFSAQPKPREKVGSRGKLVAIIVAFVLLFGVLIGVGVWWFIRDAGGSRIAGGIPPEAAVKGWYDALAKNQPQALWAAQPPDLKQDFSDRIIKMGAAAAGKPRVYTRSLGVARNFAQLIKNKKNVILGVLDYKPPAAGNAALADVLSSSLGGGDGDGLDLSALTGAAANTAFAVVIQKYKADLKIEPWMFGATADILFTLLDSDLKNIDWLQNPDLDGFVAKTGVGLMEKLDAIPAQEGENSWEKGFKAPLKEIEVKLVSQDGSTAVVEVNYPPMAFLGTSSGVEKLELILVDDKWQLTQPDLIFGAMQAGIAGADAKVRTMEQFQTVASQIDDLGGADENSLLQGLDDVDKIIVEIDRDVRTTDDFITYLRQKVMGKLEAALGGNFDLGAGLGGLSGTKPAIPKPSVATTNAAPVVGAIPNRPAGTTNSLAGPLNPNTPKGGISRRYLWLAYYDSPAFNFGSETGYSIKHYFLNKRQERVLEAFGKPDEEQNGKWIYRGLRVMDARNRKPCQTVEFNILNRSVASVVCY
jgi:hypothetical protein